MGTIVPLVVLIALVILGFVYCFGGYKYLRVVLFFYALFAVYNVVYPFLSAAFPTLGLGSILIALALGLLAGALTFFFAKLAVFVAGGMIGVMLYNVIRSATPQYFSHLSQINIVLIGLVCFIILGVITLALQHHLLIFFTAIFGGYAAVYTAGILIGMALHPAALSKATVAGLLDSLSPYSIFTGQPRWALVLPVVLFAILGIITQYRSRRRRRRR